MTPTVARLPLPALLVITALCVWVASFVRGANAHWIEPAPEVVEAGFSEDVRTSTEPDGLYHMRRVLRALEEGELASTDARLNFPEGAKIPWPPYADDASLALVALFAPEDPVERRLYLEGALSRLPYLFGLISCGMLTLAAGLLFGSLTGAAVTGLTYAINYGAIHYQAPGIADHHAWVSMLNFAALLICSFAWRRDRLQNSSYSAHQGAAAGVLIGLSLGSWVASLLWLGALQLAMGVLWLRAGKNGPLAESARGLRSFGLGFHAAALLMVLSPVLDSPWKDDFPWMVVNLSWFHLVELLLGLAVFLPRRDGRFPALVIPGGIAVLAALVLILNVGPGAGLREGFAWVSRADEFMSGIAESTPVLEGYRSWAGLGFFPALIIAFAWLRRALQRHQSEYLGLAIVLLLAWSQAFLQIRFLEAFMGPAALAYGWIVGGSLRRLKEGLPKRAAEYQSRPVPVRLGVSLSLAVLVSFPLAGTEFTRGFSQELPDREPAARRHILEWIGIYTPDVPAAEASASVLAPWDWGHEIEWRTDLASVATNFGSYVGVEGYRAPARFFLATETQQARAILERHQVRYVVRPSRLTLSMDQLERSYGEGLPEGGFTSKSTDAQGRERSSFAPRWFDTIAAQLGVPVMASPSGAVPGLGDPDGADGAAPPLDFLRLVHVSPIADEHPGHGGLIQPFGMVWEHVAGATVSRALADGESLQLDLGIQVGFAGKELISFRYQNASRAGADGRASVRTPYSTGLPNGDAQVAFAKWRVVGSDGLVRAEGDLVIAEEDVAEGLEVRLD